ncbi:hypothetical protein GCM10010420_35430 [Streptomyces glaucosporus]|uniref:Uncharacterized protein n=1 Tax=Streptomyces glaucosporus TaxID=284044 RepID=A0ABP5VLU3_9ACTN
MAPPRAAPQRGGGHPARAVPAVRRVRGREESMREDPVLSERGPGTPEDRVRMVTTEKGNGRRRPAPDGI